ncbi:PREDICTED: uncharacterized protein LOC105123441 [Populus euphratica]|uniref:Uncharacterized protein LOC105123441 n=1 Tax=Populus euphratica TaxID=75702 RepID=A0AAJ6U142_POPEU|nr:PREDICTED: uncharacterized protein LOC105123441 [Populus euphratica]
MGDHFVFLVDGLLTESTLEAAIASQNRLWLSVPSANMSSSTGELEECRICHDEDDDKNMEIPCSCRGTLKYAHRKCVQRWCNEKGDINCEICYQQFEPGYTAPRPLFRYGGIPMNFRGDWEIPTRELHAPPFIPMFTTDREYLDSDFEEYTLPSPRSVMCCRIVAIIFLVLLVLRHTLPIIISGAGEYSMTLFMLLILRTVGILLPIYVMVRAFTAIQRRRRQQEDPPFPLSETDEENV